MQDPSRGLDQTVAGEDLAGLFHHRLCRVEIDGCVARKPFAAVAGDDNGV